MKQFDAIVVGAGIAGSSTAFFLGERGVKTALIEQWRPAGGPTGKSSALTHAFYLMPELSQLAARGVDILRRVPELTGEGKVHHEIGMMWVCGEDAAPQWTEAARRIQREGSVIEILDVETFQKQAPDISTEGVAAALWEPDYGYADAYMAANALAKGARDRGVQGLFDTRVTELAVESGKVVGVVTESGERIGADLVIVAAGPWTRPLVAPTGCELPLHVERHEMAVLDGQGRAREYMPFAFCDDLLCNYARPDGDRVILCGTWSGGGTGIRNQSQARPEPVTDPYGYKEGVEESESVEVLSYILPRAPRLQELGVRPGYAGLYDMSPDDNPIMDKVPGVDGLYVVCGSSGHGFKMGAAVGEEVARLVTTGDSRLLAPFKLARFGIV